MRRSLRGPRGIGVAALAAVVATVAAVAVSGWRPTLADRVPRRVLEQAHRAEGVMTRAAGVIRAARLAEGVASEAEDGSAMSVLLGAEQTPITTTLGNLEAKRLSTSTRWAEALVLRLHDVGLRQGDVVAAGFSGSFPGLNLALVAACQSLGLRLIAVSSVTASSWGANQPGFTWPELEIRLVRASVIEQASIAISAGGAGDRALDLEPEGRAQAERIGRAASRALRVPFLAPGGFEAAVALRMRAYSDAAGRPVQLYANVGGTEPSLGRSSAVLHLRNGLLPGVPFDFSRDRGVMARFAERGTRVLTLLNVRDLALRWGIL